MPALMEVTAGLRFDWGHARSEVEHRELGPYVSFHLHSYSLTLARTTLVRLTIPESMNLVWFNYHGSVLLQSGGQVKMIPPESAAYMPGDSMAAIQFSRGRHQFEVLSWDRNHLIGLDDWISTAQRQAPHGSQMGQMQSYATALRSAIDRFESAKRSDLVTGEALILSSIYEILSHLILEPSELSIATVPQNLPDAVKAVAKSVRAAPEGSWPLRTAAKMAGYSPFHFSRVFKALFGYGYREFVDRVRTERAVKMLLATDLHADKIAADCGFGSTQAFRESIRTYLGMVPSELRMKKSL